MDPQSEQKILSVIGRQQSVFNRDLERHEEEVRERIRHSDFLVLGGAGSIGRAVVKEVFQREPRRLHVVDISENNLVELVRDIRSSHGYIKGDFQALPLDIGQVEFEAFIRASGSYDYVLNLSALKHVRSEKDPFTLMRMLAVNVLYTESTLCQAAEMGVSRYFAVSSDKAANPANAMGATKRAMELCLARASHETSVSSARFANVAFSDGSLLHGFNLRLAKRQPLAAPEDVYRYFLTNTEAGVLCLMSCLLGENNEVFFPHPQKNFDAIDFRSIAERFLEARGFQAHPCDTEDEARERVEELAARGMWPCYFFSSNTTGEKDVEEFTMAGEEVDLDRYEEIGVVRWPELEDSAALGRFLAAIRELQDSGKWTRSEILDQLKALLPEFHHRETGKFLDSRM